MRSFLPIFRIWKKPIFVRLSATLRTRTGTRSANHSLMDLLIDMNLTPRWVSYLQPAGYSAAQWSTVGDASAEDELIRAHARERRFVVFTNDLDFPGIPTFTGAHGPASSWFEVRHSLRGCEDLRCS